MSRITPKKKSGIAETLTKSHLRYFDDIAVQAQKRISPGEIQAQCFCAKPKPITIEHEIVCQGCGMVMGIDNEQVSPTESHLNLYLRTEIGASPNDRPNEIRKLHIHSSDSSQISDVCQSLFLSDALTDEIWHLYQKTKSIAKFSKAKSACFAIYYTCRKHEVPFEENTVRNKVRMSFHVLNAPTLLDVFAKISKLSKTDQRMMLATEMGLDTNSHNPEKFYLKTHLKNAQASYPHINIEKLKRSANTFFQLQKGNNDTRAKNAVRLALGRFGLQ